MPDLGPNECSDDFARLAAIFADPDVIAGKHLPQEEQDEHRRCLQSVVEARAYAEAHAHEWAIWR